MDTTQNQQLDQYGVARVPFHTHNRVDSPTIPVKNIGIIAGTIKLVAGNATIKNPAIGAKSIITATSTTSDNPSFFWMLSAGCFNGFATIKEGTGTSTDLVNYIIITNP